MYGIQFKNRISKNGFSEQLLISNSVIFTEKTQNTVDKQLTYTKPAHALYPHMHIKKKSKPKLCTTTNTDAHHCYIAPK